MCFHTARNTPNTPAAWELRTSHSSSLTCGPQTARTWIQSIALFGVPFNRWSINVDDSRQSTSWSRQASLSGANCFSVSSIAPLVSGVAGLSGSSRSKKANKLNIWCKNCSKRVTLDNNWDNINTLFPVVNFFKMCCYSSTVLFSIIAFKIFDISQGSVGTHLRCGGDL